MEKAIKKYEGHLLNELIENLIEFRKLCHNKKGKNTFILSNILSNYLFFHYLEKNLIEISYLSDIETRNEKILLLYKWYTGILKKQNSLKKIDSKSYI